MNKFLTKSDIQIALREKKNIIRISKNTRVTEEAEEYCKLCGVTITRCGFERKRYFLGNWKMNNTLAQSMEYFSFLEKSLKEDQGSYIGVALPYTHLFIGSFFQPRGTLRIGAQNFFPKENGAYTGEVSLSFLKELGVSFVLIGHSERRHVLGECQKFIDKKLAFGMKNYSGTIVYCIGETFEEKNAGRTYTVLRNQLDFLKKTELQCPEKLVIAYEPVWAIGTGLVSENEDIERVSVFIREQLNKNLTDCELGDKTSILYGGSVAAGNIASLCQVEGIDGFLIGGASLKPEVFSGMFEKYSDRLNKP